MRDHRPEPVLLDCPECSESNLFSEAELVSLGVAPERIRRTNRDVASIPGMGPESQRVDIVIKSEA